MARIFRKVAIASWDESAFCALSPFGPSGRGLYRFLESGPASTALPGVARVGPAGCAEMLGWSAADVHERFAELAEHTGALVNWPARVVFLPLVMDDNPPTALNVVVAWRRAFDELPGCDVKEAIAARVRRVLEAQGSPRFIACWDGTLTDDDDADEPTLKAQRKPKSKASGKAWREQRRSLGQGKNQGKDQGKNEGTGEGKGYPEEEEQAEAESGKAEAEILARELFKGLWTAYPKKAAKPRAIAEWNALVSAESAVAARVVAAVKGRTDARAWGDDLQFVPLLCNFLRDRRWEDELQTAAPSEREGETTQRKCDRCGREYRWLVFRAGAWHYEAPCPNSACADFAWFEDCQARHGGKCGGRSAHHTRLVIDAGKGAVA